MIGRFQELVLLALINPQGEANSTDIRRYIEGCGQIALLGAINETLKRLAEKGLVTYRKGDPVFRRGGKARNYYSITGAGRAELMKIRTLYPALPSIPELKAIT